MPRVLLTGFCAVPGPRRAGVQLKHVIRALSSMHTVDLLVVRDGDQGYVERQGSVRVLRVPTPGFDQRSQIQAFQRALKRQLDGADYDAVHCRDSWSGIPVLEARGRLGYAVVYDLTRSPQGDALSAVPVRALGRSPRDTSPYARRLTSCFPTATKRVPSTGAAATTSGSAELAEASRESESVQLLTSAPRNATSVLPSPLGSKVDTPSASGSCHRPASYR